MIVIWGVILYKVPRSFKEIVSLEEQHNVKSMSVSGNLPNGNDNMKIASDKILQVLKILNDYEYRRCIYGVTVGKGIFMLLNTDSPRRVIFIEVWESGYIRIPNNEVYKVLNKNNVELFDEITNLLK